MSEFIDVISPSALADIEAVNAKIVKTIELSKEANKNLIGAKSPSSSDSAIKSLNAELLKSQKLYADLQKTLEKVANAQKNLTPIEKERLRVVNELNRVEAKIKTIADQNTIALNTQKSVLKASAGAYAELSEKVARASKNLQDLMVRGKLSGQSWRQYNNELSKAKNEFNKLQSEILKADKAVGKWNRTSQRAVSIGRDLLMAFGVAGIATVFANIVKSVFELTKEFDSLNRALTLVTQSTEIFTQSQAFLRKTAEDFGIDLTQLTKQYTQFYVSAKDKISSTEIQGIFRSISKASASMGLTVQQQERAFLALNQMMSKGTIQAEELRGQLGEALPGAFGIMAKAVGVTEQELSKMMKAGELLASDVLPKFAKQLEKTYGIETLDRIESLVASQQKLTVAWEAYVASLQAGEGTTASVFKSITNSFASLLRMMERIDKIGLFRSMNGLLPESEIVERGVNAIDAGFANTEKTAIAYYKGERERVADIVSKYQDIRKQLEGASNLRSTEIMASIGLEGANTTAENIKIINGYLNANIKIQNIVTAKLNEEQIIRNKLLGQHVALNKIKQEDVSSEILLDVAKSKTNEQLKKEIALMSVKTDATKDATKATKANNDEKKKEVEYLEGSVEWFEKQISELKEVQKQTAISSEEWKFFDDVIKDLQNSIDIITGKAEVLGTTFQEAIKKVDFSKVLSAGVSNASKGIEDMGEGWEKTFVEWSQVALDAINTVQQAQQQANERELYNLEKQRDTAILFAGESADARAEVDRQYDEKRRALLNRQAKQDKALAITQAIINTAGAVIAGLKTSIPYAIAVGVIGAAQIALIASQQIPQFYKGTDNAPEGLAWTQEKGAELITDKKGNIKSYGSNKGAQMTYLNKGDKVFTAKETKDIMFNNELNGILTNNGISNSVVNNNVDLSPLNSRLDNLASIIKNKSEVTFVRDIQGERVYKREQGQKKILVSNRLRIKS